MQSRKWGSWRVLSGVSAYVRSGDRSQALRPNNCLASQGKVAAWERLIHTFGQRRQLPVLAKHVPTERPRLRNTAYEMVSAC